MQLKYNGELTEYITPINWSAVPVYNLDMSMEKWEASYNNFIAKLRSCRRANKPRTLQEIAVRNMPRCISEDLVAKAPCSNFTDVYNQYKCPYSPLVPLVVVPKRKSNLFSCFK